MTVECLCSHFDSCSNNFHNHQRITWHPFCFTFTEVFGGGVICARSLTLYAAAMHVGQPLSSWMTVLALMQLAHYNRGLMSANFLKARADQTKLLFSCPSQQKGILFFLSS